MTRKAASANLPALLIAGLAVIVVVLALSITGGPGQGRMERRDETRLQDLQRIAAQVECLALAADGALPADPASTPLCPADVRVADPYTGAPYRYETLSADAFRLCAGFETDLAIRMAGNQVNVDVEAGCLHFRLPEQRFRG